MGTLPALRVGKNVNDSTAATKLSRQRNGSRLYRRLATKAKQR